ncbi:MFS transporter [Microbispora sp. RL4-1S]|uniref:MFS transporter n=1 Tax=Microbispora oryzae TaxID=2806554 RepID=A0A940WDA0_9ACTN|nr:MFS transporter [Microbispora oryzae]MBP2703385.1 MFS transporter [Microbispora oryzae]
MSEAVGHPFSGRPRPRRARGPLRRYAIIEFLTWLPTGLYLAPMVLLMAARGLGVGEIGLVSAAYAVTIVVLELPTGGLADVLSRRAVLAASAVVGVLGLALMATAGTVWMFFLSSALKGVSRALSSGPAQAWYVDALHAEEGVSADLKPGLAAGDVAGSVALAVGTLAGGALPLLPLVSRLSAADALAVPVWAATGTAVVQLAAVLVLMRDPSASAGGAPTTAGGGVRRGGRFGEVLRGVPLTIVDGIKLGLTDRGLGRLLLIAAGAGVTLNTIELLTPGRLADLTGSPQTGSTAYAVVTAVGFVANALGSSLAPAVARRVGGSVRAAILGCVVVSVAVGALAASVALPGWAGIAAAAGAYIVLFAALAVVSLFRSELVHRRVSSAQRATVMSVDSLQLQFGGALSSFVLVPLAGVVGLGPVWAVTAVVGLAFTLLFVRLPSPRAERVADPVAVIAVK